MRATVFGIARMMAILGGFVLTALVILTCISVLGRGLNTFGHSDFIESVAPGFGAWLIGTGVGPVPGDFELVQSGMAFAIFAFLPICQLRGAHASVDVFTNMLPERANGWLAAFWEIVLALVILVIGWRLLIGTLDKFDTGQTTFLLQFPVWWAYAMSFVAAVVAGLVGIYCAVGRVMEQTGRGVWLDDGGEAGH